MSDRRPISRRQRALLAGAAPWAALLAILIAPRAAPVGLSHAADDGAYKGRIAAVLKAAPRFIDRWTGVDAPVPPEAQKMLRPNAVLSRTYSKPDHPPVHVLIVHCNDARDMIGHYPPICYPSSGWTMTDTPRDLMLTIDRQPRPFREYRFDRLNTAAGGSEAMRIYSSFILPDGVLTCEIDDIHRLSERTAVSVRGVAQVQFITPARIDDDAARAAAESVFDGLRSVFDVMRPDRTSPRAASAEGDSP